MKSYEKFISEAPTESQVAQMAPDMAPEKRRAALERNARNQARKDSSLQPKAREPQKSLPPGKTGGEITPSSNKSSAIVPSSNKSSAIVPSKKSQMGKWSQGIKQSPGKLARTNSSSSRTSKEAIGDPKKSGPGVRQPQGSGSKTYDRVNPKRTHKKGGDLMAPDEARMRRERELNKKLDKEDSKKGRFGKFVKGAGKAVGAAANAMAGVGTEVGSVEGKKLDGPEVGTK
tara:strand:+ start:59 stop:748 length:690 start_codon:yes stop_codon:yes gene_type:complete